MSTMSEVGVLTRPFVGPASAVMASASDKIMFEIYRESDYARLFRVVFFTELDEHNKESEIGRAMAGEHFLDGFVRESRRDEAHRVLNDIVKRLNDGASLTADDVVEMLRKREVWVDD